MKASSTEAESSAAAKADLLFINYASEDIVFAEWLERKLVAVGYAVWRDKSQMFGGESWPKEIGLALPRSYRMLSIISSVSLEKDLPLKERTSAASMGRKRGIDDFVIPLVIDGTSLNWTLSDNVPIEFQESWLKGLRQLLKKLEKIDAPKTVVDGPTRAILSIQPEGLILQEPEQLRLNVVAIESVVDLIKPYWLPQNLTAKDKSDLASAWAYYPVSEGARRVLALCPPPDRFAGIEVEEDEWRWSEEQEIKGIRTSNIITSLVKKTVHARLLALGVKRHPNPKKDEVFYLEPSFTATGKLPYSDHTGSRIPKKIQGYKSFGPKDARFKVMHNLAARISLASGLDEGFRVLIQPTIHLFQEDGNPILDKQVNTKRKGITTDWHNDEWFNRFLCMAHLLISTQADANDGVVLSVEPVWLDSAITINEKALEQVQEDKDGEEVNEAEIPPTHEEDED
ncbi:MAG TPA: toll/interleukin-1 receptor domain-containing protein [Flavobacteriales bacterium]|nr:toll/interleukin-1 receptor domain-containing protein [Flavobacteriales bacterium]